MQNYSLTESSTINFNPIFKEATHGQATEIITEVSLVLKNDILFFTFKCLNNPFVNQNCYKENNSEMWNQEVFEVFLAKGEQEPLQYLEIEVNPNGALFIAMVQNPSGSKPAKLMFFDTEECGVLAKVEKQKDSYAGTLQIPLVLLGEIENDYQINLFRIVAKTFPESNDWTSNTENAHFLCLNSTMSGEIPNFHVPKYFSKLLINKQLQE